MLRHQAEDENDSSSAANVITILCTNCKFNESVFIKEYLEDIFQNWTDSGIVPLIDRS